MFKLLIVEDEFLVRMGLIKTVDWENLGFQIVGEAENGLRALELAHETQPDLVLTDIRMPKMDGLSLMKALKAEMPRVKFLILSCYQDFEYVREAMKLGALDYIPKLSTQNEDLVKIFTKVKLELEADGRNHDGPENMQLDLNQMRNIFFNDLLNEKTPLFELPYPKSLQLRLPSQGSFLYICARIDDYRSVRENGGVREAAFSRTIVDYGDRILENRMLPGNVFYRQKGEFGVLIGFPAGVPPLQPGAYTTRAREYCAEWRESVAQSLDISLSCGVSNSFPALRDVKKAFREAAEAVELRLYHGKGSVNIYVGGAATATGIYNWSRERTLRELVENGRVGETKAVIFEMIDQIKNDGRMAPQTIKRELAEVMNTFLSLIKQYGGGLNDLQNDRGDDPFLSLESCETLSECRSWFDAFLDLFDAALTALKRQKYGREINKALEYINRHYRDDLKLGDIAGFVGLNETYFSHLFKKTTGANFTDYVNNLRIDKAKELLRTEDLSVYEVAERVGYANLSYFSRLFKQWVGMSPVDYKKISNYNV